MFFAGDFNTKHRSWSSKASNALGRDLRDYLDRRADIDIPVPDEPTYLALNASPTTRFPPGAAYQTDWYTFQQLTDECLTQPAAPTTTEELEESIADLHQTLTNSVTESSNLARRSAPHTQDKRRERNELRNQWRITRNPKIKRILNQKSCLIKTLVVTVEPPLSKPKCVGLPRPSNY